MKKIWMMGFILFTCLFIAGCSGQTVTNVIGESDNWESRIAYEIGEHEQIGKGSLEYVGSEGLDNLTYTINYPAWFGRGGDGNMNNLSEDEDHSYAIKVSLPDRNIDMVREEIEDISITIEWENVEGDSFEETINYTVQ